MAGRILTNVFEREDDPLYLLLYAAVASTCHRDYSIPGGAVSIAIYDNRIEISSTGVLPFDLTPEALSRPHASAWGDHRLASFFEALLKRGDEGQIG